MCVICGCNDKTNVRIDGEHEHVLADGTRVRHGPHGHDLDHDHDHGHEHEHEHEHEHGHSHDHEHAHSHAAYRHDAPAELVALETALLGKNQRIADRNRAGFARDHVVALNLMSSPGSGKTTLLVRTLQDLAGEIPMSVVEGDQETSADAERIRATGAQAIQINTGAGCHLEADMLERAVQQLALARVDPALPGDSNPHGGRAGLARPWGHSEGSVLFVENVGNLVCPALFDLGEKARIVVLSVTEGDDKPLKYPHMFRSAQLMVTTKMDLAPHVQFDVARAEKNARSVNPTIQCLRVSSVSGDGLADWYGWLRSMVKLAALT